MYAFEALGASLGWGVADFTGGVNARKWNPLAVAFWMEVISVPLVAVLTLAVGKHISAANFVIAFLGGGVGASALAGFYRALSMGRMGVVAPITALMAGVFPIFVGLLIGERPGIVGATGVVLALCAVTLISADRSESNEILIHPLNVLRSKDGRIATLCGIGFGVYVVALKAMPSGSGEWPVFAARFGSVAALGMVAVVAKTSLSPRWSSMPIVSLQSVLDGGANALLVLAVYDGPLVIISVLGNLYPVVTTLMARIFLHERWHMHQRVGLLLALVSIPLLSIS